MDEAGHMAVCRGAGSGSVGVRPARDRGPRTPGAVATLIQAASGTGDPGDGSPIRAARLDERAVGPPAG